MVLFASVLLTLTTTTSPHLASVSAAAFGAASGSARLTVTPVAGVSVGLPWSSFPTTMALASSGRLSGG